MSKNEGKLLIAVLAPAMVLPLLASLFYFVWFTDHPSAAAIYFATKVFTLVWPLFAWYLLLRRSTEIAFNWKIYLKSLPLGLLSGFAIAVGLFALMRTPLSEMVWNAAPAMRGKAEQLGFLEHYWTFAIFLSVVHSLLEEYYWRWFVYGRLREITAIAPAIALAALSFGAHHIVVLSQYFGLGWAIALGLIVALGGALWCLMFEFQKNVGGAWISHMIVDLAVMYLGYRLLF